MARTITFTDLLAASEVVPANSDVANSPFNPLERTSRVSLYAASTAAGGLAGLRLGSDDHGTDLILPIAAAVSTRDHLVAQGVGLRGQKMTVPVRNSGVGTPTVNAILIIEPLG